MANTDISLVMTLGGAFLLLYGLYLAHQIRTTLGSGTFKQSWDILSSLIFVFLVGYLLYAVDLAIQFMPIDPQLLIGAVFFLGAVFVVLTAYLNEQALTPDV